MDHKFKAALCAVCALLCAFCLSHRACAQGLPEGTGKAEFVHNCTACHSASMVTRVKKTPQEWRASVDDMAARGTDGTKEDLDNVVRYLDTYFASDPIPADPIPADPIPAAPQQPITWRFDNFNSIGNSPVVTVGNPQLVDTAIGKAIHFEGHGNTSSNPESGNPTGDALFLNTSPLSGFATYTFEVIFRPSSKGAPAQRFFHMQDANSASRRMFEIRIVDNQWCLDTVGIDLRGGPEQHGVTLACDAAHRHPLDRWYAVAATYDGKVLRGYVDGQLQGQLAITLLPLPPGTTSIGTRIDKRDFFTGDIYSARFTPSALPPADFLLVPTAASH